MIVEGWSSDSSPYRFRLGLYSRDGIEDNHGSIQYCDTAIHLYRKVDMAGCINDLPILNIKEALRVRLSVRFQTQHFLIKCKFCVNLSFNYMLHTYLYVDLVILLHIISSLVVVPTPLEGNGRTLNGNAPFLFGRKIVRHGGSIVDGSTTPHHPCQCQHAFRHCGLAGIDVC